MKKTGIKNNEVKKMVAGTVGAICVGTLLFSGFTQVAKAAMYKNTETVPTSYSIDSITTALTNPAISADYAKSNYAAELVDTPDRPAEKDMSMEEAAELGAQNLWRLFGEKLNDQTIYMTFLPADDFQSRALWYGEVNVNDVLYYSFQVDAVTGEYYSASRWDYSKEHPPAEDFLEDYQQYMSLAEETAEKYQLVTGNVISSDYVQQRNIGKDLVIDIIVKSDTGQEAELTFLTDSKDLVYVNYNNAVKQEKINLDKALQEEEQAENGKTEEDANAN